MMVRKFVDVILWIHARTSYETDLCRDTKIRMGLDVLCTYITVFF